MSNLPKAISRTDLYLSFLNGESVELPEPVSRVDKYLYNLCIHGGNGSIEVVAEEVAAARNGFETLGKRLDGVDSQLDENVNLINARMDTFTKLEEGSTTADAELKDIRVGVDGATYENAGEAVRGQVKNVSKLLLDETIFEGKEINLTTPISCTIKTDTEATVYSHGKNYLPFNIAMNDFENKSYYVEHGEDYVIGKALVGETFKNFYLSSIYLPTGTYVFSRKVEIIHGSATGDYGFIYVKNLDTNSFISSFRITEESKKIVLSEGANIRIDMYINMNGIVDEDLTIKFSNLQIEKGEETTNYEKYIGEIKTGTFFNFSCFENMSITSNTNMKAIVKKSKDFAKQSDLALLKKDIEDIKNTQNTVDEIIVCWGDSLTASAGSTTGKPDTEANTDVSYPAVLERLTGITTINAGVGGETSWMVAARQGGMPLEVLPATIPTTKTAIRIYFKGQEQDYFYNPETSKWEFLKDNLSYNISVDGNARVNPCKINGIEGTLSRVKLSNGQPDPETGETVQNDKYAYYFTRNEEGEENTFSTCRKLITYGSEKYKNAINVIWVGQNDAPLHEGKYITQIGAENRIKNMISHSKNKKYIIMDLPSGTNESRAVATLSFTQAFGENYLNIRNYICTYGLEISNSLGANITLSEQDNTDISNGKIPPCFRIDSVHLNYWGYQIVARALYEKGKDLGYW